MNNRILPLYLFLICSTSLVANSITSDWSNLNHSFNAPFTSTYSNLSAPPPSCEGEYFYHVAPIWKDNDKYTPNNPYISTIYDRTEVTITNATGLIQIDTFVTSGAVLPISFDQVLSNDINAVKGDVGLIIKTSTPVNIRFSIEKNTYGIITAFKGKEALGTAFSVATQTGTTADFSKDQLHFASVIATEDNTTVTFDNDGDDFRGLGTSSFMVTLDAGETYMVLPDEDDNERFEGLSIISNKPIAVNSGESHVSQGGLNAEGGVVQVLPIAKVGKEYILSRASGTANSGDFALVLVWLTLFSGVVAGLDHFLFTAARNTYMQSKAVVDYLAKYTEEQRQGLQAAFGKELVVAEYSKSFFPVLLVVMILRSFIVEPFQIPSASMVPTLQVGDYILVNKFNYGLRLPVLGTKILEVDEPARGDVMVFFPPHDNRYFIKRVIGLPGDEISYRDKVLTINGETVEQQFLAELLPDARTGRSVRLYQEDQDGVSYTVHNTKGINRGDFSVTVKPGHYFMMGDNRDNSSDSRVWGQVPEKNIVGQAFARWMYWPSIKQLPSFSRVGEIH